MSAIVAHQPQDSDAALLFRHPTLKRFLHGVAHLNPPRPSPTPQWLLHTVLRRLSPTSSEPLATATERLLTFKVLFLVAITSAKRASELAALPVDLPFLQFHPDKVTLYPDVSFLPKVSTNFHVLQRIILPTFFPKPSTGVERSLHLLDVRCALAFYVKRTASFRKSKCLSEDNRFLPKRFQD